MSGFLSKVKTKINYELSRDKSDVAARLKNQFRLQRAKRELKKLVLASPPIAVGKRTDADLTVVMLCGRGSFYEGLATLKSFYHQAGVSYPLHYHEDGTLTERELEIIERLFPGARVIRRQTADAEVNAYLESLELTECQATRRLHALMLRLFDIIFYKTTRVVLQLDSDVLFFAPPDEVTTIANGERDVRGAYNQDYTDAISFARDTMESFIGKPILRHFNAGLLVHSFDERMFAFIEQVMQQKWECCSVWHLEQTLLGLYAAHCGNVEPLPRRYDLMQQFDGDERDIISQHFCSASRPNYYTQFKQRVYPALVSHPRR